MSKFCKCMCTCIRTYTMKTFHHWRDIWNVSVINWKLIYMYRYNNESNARRMINKWNEMQSSPWIFFLGKYLLLNSTREDNSNNHINFVSTKKCINIDNKSHLECFKFIQECYLLPNTDPFLISHSQNKMTVLCKDKID